MGRRRRYGLIQEQTCLETLGNPEVKTFRENYRRLIDETISQDKCRREPAWTESIALIEQKRAELTKQLPKLRHSQIRC
jgi:hypothetical protein